MPRINGTPVNFGFVATAGDGGLAVAVLDAAVAFTGLLLQSGDESIDAEKEEVRDGIGNVVIRAYYDFHGKATLECVIKADTITNAVKNTSLSPFSPGQFLKITSCASMPDLPGISDATTGGGVKLGTGTAPGTLAAASSIWEIVSGAKITKSNTGAARISIPIEYRANIQAVAAA